MCIFVTNKTDNMEDVKKTLITRTEELKPGDVVYTYMKGAEESNPGWPRLNFHRINVVTRVREAKESAIGRSTYDTQMPVNLTSTNGDHERIKSHIDNRVISSGGTYGCNQYVEGHRPTEEVVTYRLDEIIEQTFTVAMPPFSQNSHLPPPDPLPQSVW